MLQNKTLPKADDASCRGNKTTSPRFLGSNNVHPKLILR